MFMGGQGWQAIMGVIELIKLREVIKCRMHVLLSMRSKNPTLMASEVRSENLHMILHNIDKINSINNRGVVITLADWGCALICNT